MKAFSVHLAIVYEVIMGVCYLVVRSYPCVLYTWCLAGHPPDSEQESAHFILVVYLVGARRITLLRVNMSRNTLFSNGPVSGNTLFYSLTWPSEWEHFILKWPSEWEHLILQSQMAQ